MMAIRFRRSSADFQGTSAAARSQDQQCCDVPTILRVCQPASRRCTVAISTAETNANENTAVPVAVWRPALPTFEQRRDGGPDDLDGSRCTACGGSDDEGRVGFVGTGGCAGEVGT